VLLSFVVMLSLKTARISVLPARQLHLSGPVWCRVKGHVPLLTPTAGAKYNLSRQPMS